VQVLEWLSRPEEVEHVTIGSSASSISSARVRGSFSADSPAVRATGAAVVGRAHGVAQASTSVFAASATQPQCTLQFPPLTLNSP
jgi:hypothetical protein